MKRCGLVFLLPFLAVVPLLATAAEATMSATAATPMKGTDSIDWGSATSGLRSRIWTEKEKFGPKDAVPIHYCIQNVSTSDQTIWHSGFWPNHKIELIGPDGASIDPKSFDPNRAASAPGGGSEKNVPFTLKPDEIDSAYIAYNLRDLFVLRQNGTYRLRYIYRISKTELVTSNWLELSIDNSKEN